ncbi:MAG: hypothetical protein ABIH23_02765 [bacterium]
MQQHGLPSNHDEAGQESPMRTFFITTEVLILMSIIAVAPQEGKCLSADQEFRIAAGQRQLFLDDYCIATTENLKRTMHQPTKKGAVIEPDRPWETALQTRCAPAWDENEKTFKLWLITSTSLPGVAGTTYVESKDGIHWTKPNLHQYEFDGSSENNFVTLDPKASWPENAIENVVYDPDDADRNRRYKGFLGCDGRQPMVGPDGIHWKLLDVPKIPSQDESNLSYDRLNRTFIATLKQGGPYGRSHGLSTSRDFEDWTTPELIFHADEEDQTRVKANIEALLSNAKLQQPIYNDPADYNADIYNVSIFQYEGIYVALPAVYHSTGKLPEGNTDGFHLIQLACSRDLRTWKRLGDRQPFIGPSPVGPGNYDTTQILPPSAPVIHGDELWFYYTGIKYRATPDNPDPNQGAICLAVLRRDGFISLDAGETPGVLVTKPFAAGCTKLFVNVDAGMGTLEVEILDEKGNVLAVSEPVIGDKPRAQMQWKEGNLEELKDRKLGLRFTLRNVRFYSFWLED